MLNVEAYPYVIIRWDRAQGGLMANNDCAYAYIEVF